MRNERNLSRQEESVLMLASAGLSDKEVAGRLEIGLDTVRTYWMRIRTKMAVSSRAEALAALGSREAQSLLEGQQAENLRLLEEISRRKIAESLLAESELRFRSLCESSLYGIFLLDAEGVCHFTNPVFDEILGMKPKQIVEHSIFDLAAWCVEEELVQRAAQSLASEGLFEADFPAHTADGRDKFLRVRMSRADQGERTVGYTGVLRDLTKRRRLQQQLADARKLGELISLTTQDIVYIMEVPGPRMLYVNPVAEQFFGIQASLAEELDGTPVVMHPDDSDKVVAFRDRYMALKDGEVAIGECRVLRADGVWVPVQSRATVLQRGPDGVPTQCLGITRPLDCAECIHSFGRSLPPF